ncbi:hypothetical protein [Lentibacillus sp. CBA3610]|uniref:hypothetical protein n=1 Tax=Lentibacillus sp. CBA3610 TaxID=2518176 RepID=UPI0015962D01|nr:hypothetical protein [Lentibacillus sp. CBA3610]
MKIRRSAGISSEEQEYQQKNGDIVRRAGVSTEVKKYQQKKPDNIGKAKFGKPFRNVFPYWGFTPVACG